MRGFSGEGRAVLAALSREIETARAVLAELEAGRRALGAQAEPAPRAVPHDARREIESGR